MIGGGERKIVKFDKEMINLFFFFFSSRRRHTRSLCDWSSDVCSSDLVVCAEILWQKKVFYLGQKLCLRYGVLPAAVQIFQIGRASCRERV